MNIVVCLKQVPDTTAEKKLNAEFRLDRASVENIVNPFDEYAIEEALKIGRHKTKRETVNAALREYILLRKQQKVKELFGTIEYDSSYDYKKQRSLK